MERMTKVARYGLTERVVCVIWCMVEKKQTAFLPSKRTDYQVQSDRGQFPVIFHPRVNLSTFFFQERT